MYFPSIMYFSICQAPILLIMSLIIPLSAGVNDRFYLYHSIDSSVNHKPVQEYLKQFQTSDENHKQYMQRVNHPPFLDVKSDKNRIVIFYSPWCGHCKNYKSKYIQIARDVNDAAPHAMDFHAVSCVAHKSICKDQGATKYPTLKYFAAAGSHSHADDKGKTGVKGNNIDASTNKSTNATLDKDTSENMVTLAMNITAENILKDFLHIDISKNNKESEALVAATIGTKNDHSKKVEAPKATKSGREIQAQAQSQSQSQSSVFYDATRSFQFALRNSIFMSNHELNDEEYKAFKQWLELLQHTIPPGPDAMDSVKNDVEAIRLNIESARLSEENMLNYVTKEDMDMERDMDWSENCSKGKPGEGYTCGLWELFHTMSIGYVQWNMNEQSAITKQRKNTEMHTARIISTADAAERLKGYIEHFFGCDECRKHFLLMYEGCHFGRCERLNSDIDVNVNVNVNANVDSWKQFPLWLWETHNDVNVRLMHEARARLGAGTSSGKSNEGKSEEVVLLEQEQEARWPSKKDCPKCWHDGGGWEENEVFEYLTSHYWPSSDQLEVPLPLPLPLRSSSGHEGMVHPPIDTGIDLLENAVASTGAEIIREFEAVTRKYSFLQKITISTLAILALLVGFTVLKKKQKRHSRKSQ